MDAAVVVGADFDMVDCSGAETMRGGYNECCCCPLEELGEEEEDCDGHSLSFAAAAAVCAAAVARNADTFAGGFWPPAGVDVLVGLFTPSFAAPAPS